MCILLIIIPASCRCTDISSKFYIIFRRICRQHSRIDMKRDFHEFKIKIDDIITPFSCSAMVIEFIKYVIYQKQLIPYPYERLKMYVNRRRKMLDPTQQVSNTMNAIGRSVHSINT